MPDVVVALLIALWLGVLVTLALTGWRLLAHLGALRGALVTLAERLAPSLRELETAARAAQDHAERLSGTRRAPDRRRGAR